LLPQPRLPLEDHELLFRAAPSRLLVLAAEPGFVVVEASDAWLRSRRMAREEVLGQPFLDLVAESEAAPMRASLARVVASRTADERNAPVFGPDGRLRYLIHRDAVEVELLRSEHEREEAIRQLRAAKDELEAFAYSASHDLRAPIRAIGAYCALLRNLEPQMPATATDLLARMDANIGRMASIVEGLMRLSRVDRSRMSRRRVDLGAIARRTIRDLQFHEPGRHVAVSIDEGLEVSADETLISIALENLIGNAWKYTSKCADARIEVGRRTVVGQDVFYVRDNGTGFDMARAGKLFTPFFRLHSAAEFEGHGIGLATVRRVVERHGGQVWAEAAPERGATIRFTLGAGPPG
jgi:signal transduction histidine kinase